MFGIITGYICLFCFCILLAKALTRKLGMQKADRLFMKLHKPASGILLIACTVHMILVFPVLKMRNPAVIVTGICAVVTYLLLIIFCHNSGFRILSKNLKKNVSEPAAYKLRLHRVLSLIMLVCIAAHIIFYYIDFSSYKNRIVSASPLGIDMSQTADGTYIGEYDAGYIYAKVSVTVTNGIITDIRLLEHRHQRGQDAEQVTQDIIASQRINVDAISGATNSSLVIEKAVENALTQSGLY